MDQNGESFDDQNQPTGTTLTTVRERQNLRVESQVSIDQQNQASPSPIDMQNIRRIAISSSVALGDPSGLICRSGSEQNSNESTNQIMSNNFLEQRGMIQRPRQIMDGFHVSGQIIEESDHRLPTYAPPTSVTSLQPPDEGKNIYQNVSQKLHVNARQGRPTLHDDLILEGMQSDPELNDIGDKLNLSPRNAVGSELRSFFICQICQGVILDPLECQKCQTAFCNKCIQEWISQNPVENQEKCPIRCTQTKFQPMHRFAKQELKQQKFQCPFLKDQGISSADDDSHPGSGILEYDEALKHLRTCPYRTVKCQCGEKISFKQIPQHLQFCTKARVYCRNCEISYNFQKEDHDCIAYLKQKFQDYKKSQHLVHTYESNIGAQCPNGHPLYPQRGKTSWQRQFGLIFCDTCKVSDLSAQKCFWRCLHQCDFDLCHQCMYKAMPLPNPLSGSQSGLIGPNFLNPIVSNSSTGAGPQRSGSIMPHRHHQFGFANSHAESLASQEIVVNNGGNNDPPNIEERS